MKDLLTALRLFVVLSVLTGIAYPLVITGIAQAAFPSQANGSLIIKNGNVVGSKLIGQSFDNPKYFWGRLSATAPFAYNAGASSGSNLGPTNPALLKQVGDRVSALQTDRKTAWPVPTDLATASGSGLDPHISPEAALYQVPRVARARQLGEQQVRQLVNDHVMGRQFGLGEPTVNVLELNLALDEIRH